MQLLAYDSHTVFTTYKQYSCNNHHYHTTFRFRAIVKRRQIYRPKAINMSTGSTESGPGCCSEYGLTKVSSNSRTTFEAANLTLTRKNTARHVFMPYTRKDFVVVTMCLLTRIHVSTQTRLVFNIRSTTTPSRMTFGALAVATKRRFSDSQSHIVLRNG